MTKERPLCRKKINTFLEKYGCDLEELPEYVHLGLSYRLQWQRMMSEQEKKS